VKMGINFRGEQIFVSGELSDPQQDVVATLTGPEVSVELWQKQRMFGVWVNGRKRFFTSIPSYYFWATSNEQSVNYFLPLEKYLLLVGENALSETFYDRLSNNQSDTEKIYSNGLLQTLSARKNYFVKPMPISKVNNQFYFVAPITPESPIGRYHLNVYYLMNKHLVGTRQAIVIVDKTGIEEKVSNFAKKNSLLYGLVAIMIAGAFGYGSSLIYGYVERRKEKRANKK
ncbi:MAG: TIGR02186 family protein, partial [Alphaproteobacteria bacterium]|nr:TIGR02186 family protein [Alphaproteobacteria bacterium]